MENTDSRVVQQLLVPLERFLNNKSLFEVVVNKPGEVWTEGTMGWERFELPELTFDKLIRLARAVASYSEQGIDETRPLLSATLPCEERIQIVVPPATSRNTVSLTIRKPSTVALSLSEMEAKGLFIKDAGGPQGRKAEEALLLAYRKGQYRLFLEQAVVAKKNIIISGATGSGKTTLSKALIKHIPGNERLISIEDTPELTIPQPNHVRLFYSKGSQSIARVGPKQLLESCLRMRPDRVLLQELRDGTAFYYIRNINSGHPGSITTLHADSPELAFEQLTLLIKESEGGRDLNRGDIRSLLKQSVDIIVQCCRAQRGFKVTDIYFAAHERTKSNAAKSN